jgi:predicted methyltransferase
MTRSRNMLAAAAAVAILSAGFAAMAATAPVDPAVAAAVADPARPAADRARDGNRKPAEIVTFAGVRPGMTVVELNPGGGYYTRILSKAVGPQGKVFAIVNPAAAARPNGLAGIYAVAAAHPNVQVMALNYTSFTVPEPADVVWTTENYHDFHNGPTADIAGLNKAAFNALKPGGFFFVEDHSAAPGAGAAATSAVHRMDEAVAKAELVAAGFTLDAQSTLLANPNDDRSRNPENAVTPSDRFALRMKKPG